MQKPVLKFFMNDYLDDRKLTTNKMHRTVNKILSLTLSRWSKCLSMFSCLPVRCCSKCWRSIGI